MAKPILLLLHLLLPHLLLRLFLPLLRHLSLQPLLVLKRSSSLPRAPAVPLQCPLQPLPLLLRLFLPLPLLRLTNHPTSPTPTTRLVVPQSQQRQHRPNQLPPVRAAKPVVRQTMRRQHRSH
uniref:Secreted protein n=1 Tax=Cacopsylla melanoneura TaxID=428564 RepID=A0A8D8WPM1_9HEMI